MTGNTTLTGNATIGGNASVTGTEVVSGTSQQLGGIPINLQTGAYTFASSDCGKKVWDYGATASHTYTVPTGLVAGCRIIIEQATTYPISFAAVSGETLGIPPGATSSTGGQWAAVTLDVMTTSIAGLH